MIRNSFGWLIIACILTACAPPPPPTPAATAASTPIPSATATAAPVSVPSATPPLPTPTALPADTLLMERGGFALHFPANWKVKTQSDEQVDLIDGITGMLLVASSWAAAETYPLDDLTEEARNFFNLDEKDFTPSDAEEIALMGDLPAAARLVTLNESKREAYLVFAHHLNRQYRFCFILPTGQKVDALRITLNRLLQQIDLFSAYVFATPRDQTLVQTSLLTSLKELDPALYQGERDGLPPLLFAGLVQLGTDLQVRPDLAAAWEISPDGLQYTFTLLAGLSFANGRPITAQHVKTSWERSLLPETDSPSALLALGSIGGAGELHRGEQTGLSGVDVLDERRLRVTLSAPVPYFLYQLSLPAAAVYDVHEAEINPEGWVKNASFSGPYQIEEYRQNDTLLLSRNRFYPTPALLPYRGYFTAAAGSLLPLVEGNLVDLLPIKGQTVLRLSHPEEPLHNHLVSSGTMCSTLLIFNNRIPPLDQLAVRQALAAAIDTGSWISNANLGLAIPAAGIIPPGMPGYRDRTLPASQIPPLSAEQRSDLTEAPLILTTSGYLTDRRADLDLLADGWQKKLGVTLQIDLLNPDTFIIDGARNNSHLLLTTVCAGYPDPHALLDPVFHSTGELNLTRFSDPEVDRLLEEARSMRDRSQRLSLYQTIEDRLLSENIVLPLDYPVRFTAINPQLKGWSETLLPIRNDTLTLSPADTKE